MLCLRANRFLTRPGKSFFANRVRIMSGRWEFATVCWSLSAVRYVILIIAAVEEIRISVQTEFNDTWKWIVVFVLAIGAVNDILIALGLGYYLSKNKSGISRCVYQNFFYKTNIGDTFIARTE